MKTIALTKGMVALVDDEDYEFLNQWKWYSSHSRMGNYYARRDEIVGDITRRVFMHRVIAGAVSGQYVDHINHVTLDNRRSNLRKGTQSQNMGNLKMRKANTSGFKGVCWNKKRQKWQANVRIGRRNTTIGKFDNKLEAALAYDNAATKEFGEYALTNRKLGLL